jgi:hypothetical protein
MPSSSESNSLLRQSMSLNELSESNSKKPQGSPGGLSVAQPSPVLSVTTTTPTSRTSNVPPMPGTQTGLSHWIEQQSKIASTTTLPSAPGVSHSFAAPASKCAVFWDVENVPSPTYVDVESVLL